MGRSTKIWLAALLCVQAFAWPVASFAVPDGAHKAASAPKPAKEAATQPAPIVQDYQIRPALWKIADEDTTIHLFGTFHVLPKGFRWRPEQFDTIVQSATELVVETSDADLDKQTNEIVPLMVMKIATRRPTSEQLSPEGAIKWRQLIDAAGQPFDEFDSLPIFIAMVGLGLEYLKTVGSSGEYGVETALEAEFLQRDLPAVSIENGAEVFKHVLAIDEGLAVESLETTLAKWDGKNVDTFLGSTTPAEEGADKDAAKTSPLADAHKWARGEDVGFAEGDFPEDAYGRLLQKVILTDRNRAWAQWLDGRMDRPGNVLLAVGAGHFTGRIRSW